MTYSATALIKEGEPDAYEATIEWEYDGEADDVEIISVTPNVDPAYEPLILSAARYELAHWKNVWEDAQTERKLDAIDDRAHGHIYWE